MDNGLFDNPMVTNALKALSPEDVEKYKKIGEQMYGSVNFQDSKILNNVPAPVEEAVAYVEEGLKSGLHPKDLDNDELYCLIEAYGEEWYKKYGYTRAEVPEPGLNLDVKEKLDRLIDKKIELEQKKIEKIHKKKR